MCWRGGVRLEQRRLERGLTALPAVAMQNRSSRTWTRSAHHDQGRDYGRAYYPITKLTWNSKYLLCSSNSLRPGHMTATYRPIALNSRDRAFSGRSCHV